MTGRLLFLSLFLVGGAMAQMGTGSSDTTARVRIRLVLPAGAPCTPSSRVSLVGNTGFSFAETSATGECIASFFDIPSGKYRVALSGDVANADDGEVEVSAMQDVEVRARRADDPTNSAGGSPTFVSVSDLRVPISAAKQFGKANQMIAKRQWSKAADRLQSAVTLYPAYAAAYNNLGAVYSREGKNAQAREALLQAITLDGHLAAAYVNLARVDFADKNFADAEALLNRESSLAELTANELDLLAYAELMNQHFDQAVETSRRGHGAQLEHHAFLHLIAAHVYERENRIADSVAELQTYLEEEPTAPRCDEVKKAIATLQAQVASANPSSRTPEKISR